jgi:hypothetical protein
LMPSRTTAKRDQLSVRREKQAFPASQDAIGRLELKNQKSPSQGVKSRARLLPL